jgi:hypothetical protein
MLYFCLDAKVPKNQGWLKLSEIIFVSLRENKLIRGILPGFKQVFPHTLNSIIS